MIKILLGFILLTGVSMPLVAAPYATKPEANADTVYFRSDAKLEFIEGTTSAIRADFNLTDSTVTGRAEVDLRLLKTGIDTRDEHMRDRHLHTKEYPYAYFQLDRIAGLPTSWKADSTYSFDGYGTFSIHGTRRPITVSLEVMPSGEGAASFAVRSRFAINLDDFGIERPRALFLKLAETIKVEVIFHAYRDLPSHKILLPDWKEQK